jgi:hypothetical protein
MFLDGVYGVVKMSMLQKSATSMAHVPLNMTLNVFRVISCTFTYKFQILALQMHLQLQLPYEIMFVRLGQFLSYSQTNSYK